MAKLTPKQQTEVDQAVAAIRAKQAEDPSWPWSEVEKTLYPNQDGTCRTEECGGRVVAQVCGMSHGRFHHQLVCESCGRQYHGDPDNYTEHGRQEFLDLLNTPMTI